MSRGNVWGAAGMAHTYSGKLLIDQKIIDDAISSINLQKLKIAINELLTGYQNNSNYFFKNFKKESIGAAALLIKLPIDTDSLGKILAVIKTIDPNASDLISKLEKCILNVVFTPAILNKYANKALLEGLSNSLQKTATQPASNL